MKKGFTLVELLAVIVILALILVIAVPKVMDAMSKSRQDSFDASARTVYKSLEDRVKAYNMGVETTNLADSTAFAVNCPSDYWNSANGVCKYTFSAATGLSSLQVRLSSAAGKFNGASQVTFNGVSITHP
ncbi:MAG: type II secretion system protein [Bacilli bacterium]|nr:type II secretion system protein [Bacilli bacterium]